MANFPMWEMIGLGVLGAADLAVDPFKDDLVEARGNPAIGSPPAFDRWMSNALYPGLNHERTHPKKFLKGAPGFIYTAVFPAAYLGAYGVDTAFLWFDDGPLFNDANPDHHLFGYLETYLLTSDLTLAAKIGVGRRRPQEELNRVGADPTSVTSIQSFWSTQAAVTFSIATYAWMDLSDALNRGPLSDMRPSQQIVLGQVLPGLVIFGGATVTAMSRVIEQKHWLSDVVVGATVGTTIGVLDYMWHFDENGRPRNRTAESNVTFLAGPGEFALAGRF